MYKYKYTSFCEIRGDFCPVIYLVKISLVLIFKGGRVSLFVQTLPIKIDCLDYAVTGGNLQD